MLAWIQYLSPIAYSNKALAQNEFEGLVFTCEEGSSLCYETGLDVLNAFKYNDISIPVCIAINLGLMMGFTILGFAFFQKTSRPSELLEISEVKDGEFARGNTTSTIVPITEKL